jgi:Carbohydrate family 9 binding domain-like
MRGALPKCAKQIEAARATILRAGVASATLLLISGNAWGADAASSLETRGGLLRPAMDMAPPTSPEAPVVTAAGPPLRPSLGVQSSEPASPSANPARNFTTYIPTAKATRIEAAEAPVIDGDITDAVWAKAQVIDEFYQIDPDVGQPGSERTELRFLYDANTLYVAIYNFDREPNLIGATIKGRDGNVFIDDSIRLLLDPLNTRRNAYYFEINPLGARVDELIQNNTDFIKEWNTIWSANSKIVADGWTAEMAIPFRDLSFDPEKPDWVIDFARTIRRRNERVRWSSIRAGVQTTDISRGGTLTGISDINQGLGLDIQLYGSLRYRFDWQDPQRETKSGRLSGNAFYKITPQLTGTLTVNPDFSDSPLDILQVNTTRFNLFQPETRNFFLQDTATFEFGGRGFAAGFDYPYPTENASPFFSRNIGLANGLPVSIISGGKLSGEYGGFGIGALSVITNGTGDTKRNQVLSIARITKIIGESKAGILVTNGDPTGRSRNTLVGADFQFLNSNITPGQSLQSDVYYQRTFSDTKGDDDAFGLAVTYPNEPYGGELRIKQIGKNFTPALGFVNRSAIRQYDGRFQYRDRGLFGLRWYDAGAQGFLVTGLNNHVESQEYGLFTGVNFRTTDSIYGRVLYDYEDVPTTFKVAGKVPVQAGQYSWFNINPYFSTSTGRSVFFRGSIICCSFYNGNYFNFDLRTDWRITPTFQFVPHYAYTYVDLPGGLLNIHLFATDFIINFTPDMQIFSQLQYDNISQRFALSMRYRWEYEPGQEIFASVGQSALVPGETFVPRSTQAVIRLGHTFRY